MNNRSDPVEPSLDHAIQPFFELENVITPHEAKLLIGNANERGWEPGRISSTVDTDNELKEIRSCEVSPVDASDEKNAWLYNAVWDAGQHVNVQSFRFGIFDLEQILVLKYEGSTNDHYVWHADACITAPYRPTQRKLSCSIALNDAIDYEGGHLQISNTGNNRIDNSEQHLSRVGNATFFPSFLRHRVTPVTKGTRYSIVAWFEGPRWI